jgi:serine/threonine protein kinase
VVRRPDRLVEWSGALGANGHAAAFEGGMGKVCRGLDTRLDRSVAIKISAEQFTKRFEREARAISALNHPHICTLYDAGPNYLVTELVDGETLRDWFRRGQVLEALRAAHIVRALSIAT